MGKHILVLLHPQVAIPHLDGQARKPAMASSSFALSGVDVNVSMNFISPPFRERELSVLFLTTERRAGQICGKAHRGPGCFSSKKLQSRLFVAGILCGLAGSRSGYWAMTFLFTKARTRTPDPSSSHAAGSGTAVTGEMTL